VLVLHDDTAALQAIHQNEIAFMSAGTISPINPSVRNKPDGT